MYTQIIDNEVKEQLKHAINEVRKDRPRYLLSIKELIDKALFLINQYDKIYVLGALGSKLMQSIPNSYNQFLANYKGEDKEGIEDELMKPDDEIEVLLEYAISLATSSENVNLEKIPNKENIEEIYNLLSQIKSNINFWELSADIPKDGNESDHWLRTNIIQDAINVRGDGYQTHILEIFQEVFAPHNAFLNQYYKFDTSNLLDAIGKLESLVTSKVGNPYGSRESYKRLMEWSQTTTEEAIHKTMKETGKHFMQQFLEANPDLYDESSPEHVTAHKIDNIESYKKLFWVIPKTETEKLIFEKLSHAFGGNAIFMEGRFKGFPLNDSILNLKPIIKVEENFYYFSVNLAFRNIFKITEELIEQADSIYYEHYYKGNSNYNSRDNYLERKTMALFQKLVPTANFYHSLKYNITEDGKEKRPELDILGISGDTIYIIEVKAGELNEKHRRGAMKGLKDRIEETISEGSYQCHRALNYIQQNAEPIFDYAENGTKKTLKIDKSIIKSIFKISVTLEHFSAISANLKYLIESGILSPDYKWTWIVSLYDLMIFSDLIENENDFKEYLNHRFTLYDRNDIEFSDEIDILGFYLKGNFPLKEEKKDNFLQIVNFKDEIDAFYTNLSIGTPSIKPKKI